MCWKNEKSKLSMLYYKDHIPDLEMCKIKNCETDQIDETIQRVRNEYATKVLTLFFLQRKIRFSLI
jgi:hypothetical protein